MTNPTAIAAPPLAKRPPFGVLVERYQEVAFRAAYLIVRDAATAEDVAQEAFVRAYRQTRARSGRASRSGRGCCASSRTWRSTRCGRAGAASGLVDARGRDGSLEARVAARARSRAADEASTLLRAIDELPDDDRVVLYLRYFLELPEREIADGDRKPPGTVKSRLHRASGRLRELIERKYPSLKEHANA